MKKELRISKSMHTCASLFSNFSFAMIIMIFQNAGNTNSYCVGDFECPVPNTAMIFLAGLIYILF